LTALLIYDYYKQIQSIMISTPRHIALLNLLQTDVEVPVQELAERLGISESTVRRDLTHLSKSKRVHRTHGGAMLRSEFLQEASFQEKRIHAASEKKQIAKRVAADVPSGCTLFIDSGTTCLEAARELLRRGDCRIFTNSLPILVEGCSSRSSVIALGGEVRGISKALVGSGTLSGLDTLRVDIAFIGTSGLHETEGAFTTEAMEASVKTGALRRAGEAWLLADRSKWQQASALRFAEWSDFRRWYVETDSDIHVPPHCAFPELKIPTSS